MFKALPDTNMINPCEPMIYYIMDKDGEPLKSEIQKGADVNIADSNGFTLLMFAVSVGFTKATEILIKAGANVNAVDNIQQSAINYGAEKGQDPCISLLINAGADVNNANIAGVTSLVLAARKGNFNTIDLLLQAGADVNKADMDNVAPLMWAVYYGEYECCKRLIKSGGSLDIPDNNGKTAFFYAVKKDDCKILDLFLTSVGESTRLGTVKRIRSMLLEWSLANGSYNSLFRSIKAGAGVNRRDMHGRTPVMVTAAMGFDSCLRLLIMAGADINAVNNTGETALLQAGTEQCVESLLQAGADVNIVDTRGNTALINATLIDNSKRMGLLLKSGADVNRVNFLGETAVTKAAIYEGFDSLKLLTEGGADMSLPSHKNIVIRTMEIGTSGDIVKLLIKSGADVNTTGITDLSPLYLQAMSGNVEMLKLLIKAGADVNYCNGNKGTALVTTACNGHLDCARVLLKANAQINTTWCNLNVRSHDRATLDNVDLIHLLFVAGEGFHVFDWSADMLLEQGLASICRSTIRRHLLRLDPHTSLFHRVSGLGLPVALAHYLLHNISLDE